MSLLKQINEFRWIDFYSSWNHQKILGRIRSQIICLILEVKFRDDPFPSSIYLLKVNKKTLEQGVNYVIVNSKANGVVLVSLLLTLNMQLPAGLLVD